MNFHKIKIEKKIETQWDINEYKLSIEIKPKLRFILKQRKNQTKKIKLQKGLFEIFILYFLFLPI